jgi:lysozyme
VAKNSQSPNSSRQSVMRTRQEEGLRTTPYRDTRGLTTVGVGANISDPSVARLAPREVVQGTRAMTIKEANDLFSTQLEIARGDAKYVFGSSFDSLDPVRQGALVDMAFNMGRNRLSGFKKLKSAISAGDFTEAAKQIQDSNYYRAKDTNPRASRNMQILLTGKPVGGP